MMKKPASLSCSFGLFGLSGPSGLFCLSRSFGCLVSLGQATKQTRWTRQTGLVPDVQAIEILLKKGHGEFRQNAPNAIDA
jgi:hypothetical protein